MTFPEPGRKTAQELSRMYRSFDRSMVTWQAVWKWLGGGKSRMTGIVAVYWVVILICYCSSGSPVLVGGSAG